MRYKYVSFLLAALLAAGIVFAEPWDITGTWVLGFYSTKYPGGNPYLHDMIVSGSTATGGWPSGGPYTNSWTATVTVIGNGVTIIATYLPGSGVYPYQFTATGTIAQDGTISGTWSDTIGDSGNWNSITGAATDLDSDDDGVLNDDDLCSETSADILNKELGTNRWMWNGDSWITNLPKGEGPDFTVTMEDTHGCSCNQILSMMDDKMKGHWKFGCSKSVMEEFIESQKPQYQYCSFDATPSLRVDATFLAGENGAVEEWQVWSDGTENYLTFIPGTQPMPTEVCAGTGWFYWPSHSYPNENPDGCVMDNLPGPTYWVCLVNIV